MTFTCTTYKLEMFEIATAETAICRAVVFALFQRGVACKIGIKPAAVFGIVFFGNVYGSRIGAIEIAFVFVEQTFFVIFDAIVKLRFFHHYSPFSIICRTFFPVRLS